MARQFTHYSVLNSLVIKTVLNVEQYLVSGMIILDLRYKM